MRQRSQEEFYGTVAELREREQFYLDTVDRTMSLNLSFVATGGDMSPEIVAKRSRFGAQHHAHNPETIHVKNVFSGEVFTGIRSVFYRKYNLDSGRVGKLLQGSARSYNGWVLYDSDYVPKPFGENGKDLTIYTFVNVNASEEFVGTQSDMYKRLGQGQRHINDLVQGRAKSYHGWTIRRC